MATRKKKATGPTPIEATQHTEASRLNIPTAELEKFAEDEEKRPTRLLYPRDPSLDPQLVWKGKDEQDAADLEVPAVPIYIQETIEPQSIIEDLRRRSKEESPDDQMQLFGDSFGDLEFEDRVDFYRHSGKWTNRMILGDSLLVMASLAEKEGLKGQIQMIYIDPPYGIKFGVNWQVSTRKKIIRDGKPEDATRQLEQVRAFRDTWEFGVHSYLSYMRDRLVMAHDLLTQSGSVFVQIGDANVHLVRALLDEVFGSANFVSQIAFKTKMPLGSTFLPNVYDHILWYAKARGALKYRPVYSRKAAGVDTLFDRIEEPDGSRRRATAADFDEDGNLDAQGRLYRVIDLNSAGLTPSCVFDVEIGGRKYSPTAGKSWKTNPEGMSRLLLANRVVPQGNGLGYVFFHDDFAAQALVNVWTDTRAATRRRYVVETSETVIERCLLMTTDPGDLVLDPTCGGGTTAVVGEKWGRRWITVDTSRVALALARTRLMSAKFPYYLLADSPDGGAKEGEIAGQTFSLTGPFGGDLRKGFVCARIPRVTLGSVAQNPDIKEGMTREEIATAIARHAETEFLFDRPYEDKRVVRVTGPLTVESLSPHSVSTDSPDEKPANTNAFGADSARFVERIIDELRAAGVQNTHRGEKLILDALEPFAGMYLQAAGTYQEDGKPHAVAVALGPEYGTVGKELVREAAKEAAEFADTLIICGFAFEALVTEESKVGKLRILKAKMNPDLQMPDLLKKTGAGNLFMIFGEPDIDVRPADTDWIQVEIRGVDVYDPTTGQVRSHSTDDIACWFIDTDYNGESFFVRHAYFSGGDDPYDKLKRALKADIDEEAWASLYSTTSRPFPRPDTGKIAVKVINHYGDEVMKVYEA